MHMDSMSSSDTVLSLDRLPIVSARIKIVQFRRSFAEMTLGLELFTNPWRKQLAISSTTGACDRAACVPRALVVNISRQNGLHHHVTRKVGDSHVTLGC